MPIPSPNHLSIAFGSILLTSRATVGVPLSSVNDGRTPTPVAAIGSIAAKNRRHRDARPPGVASGVYHAPVLAWLAYPVLGAVSGFSAGLLGVGGGIVVVPGLLYVFSTIGMPPDHRMRLALGTSLAVICFTALSSLRAHHRRGAVDWGVVRAITPGIAVGTLSGTYVAAFIPGRHLEAGYAVFLTVISLRLVRRQADAPRGDLPPAPRIAAAGLGIGLLSGLVGIGGGSLTVPFLARSGVTIHRAVGTSAAVGAPIAIVGAGGYILNGVGEGGLPPFAFGYVYLPALIGVSVVSSLFAPLGATIAHRLPVARLRAAFAAFLVLVAVRMLFEQLRGFWS
ncbi:MAG: sulfite exporter TauE/SafE family protein [Polyangiaceae bacterium]|nr:sulfite exporter TauE/SafE family protein [Polyangiaceae bacterium]